MVDPVEVPLTRRLGLKAMRAAVYRFCRLYVTYAPTIQILFVTNVALIAAMEAANLACAELVKQIDEATTPGV